MCSTIHGDIAQSRMVWIGLTSMQRDSKIDRFIQRSRMATVWASRTGKWVRDPKGDGWSHVFEFNHFPDLIGKLEGVRPSLIGQVEKLSIVARGGAHTAGYTYIHTLL